MINNKGRQQDSSGWHLEQITDALNKQVPPTKQWVKETAYTDSILHWSIKFSK